MIDEKLKLENLLLISIKLIESEFYELKTI